MKEGKYYNRPRNCYVITNYRDLEHQKPLSMTIFRSFKDVEKEFPNYFKHPQDMNDYITRYCTKNKLIKNKKGRPTPNKAFLFIQKTRLLLPCFHKYGPCLPPSCEEIPCLVPTPAARQDDIEDMKVSTASSRVFVETIQSYVSVA